MEILTEGDVLVVRYRRRGTGSEKTFDLVLAYLNEASIFLSLSACRVGNQTYEPYKLAIDLKNSEWPAEEAVDDIARLRWHIFRRQDRGRILPPVVGLWDYGDWTIAACLPEAYGGLCLSLAEQEKWFDEEPSDDPPDPERMLCWWPDPQAWEAAGRRSEALRLAGGSEVAVGFFTFSEWLKRRDVRIKLAEDAKVLDELEAGSELKSRVLAEIAADEYARYLRKMRTCLLYYRRHSIPAKVVLGNAALAEEFFAEEGLSPDDPEAWTSACRIFPEMPEVVVEDLGPRGPWAVVPPRSKCRASVSFYSHFPGTAPAADAVGVVVEVGSRHVRSFVLWPNPLFSADPDHYRRLVGALRGEAARSGAEELIVLRGTFGFEVCPCCGEMVLAAAGGGLRGTPVKAKKTACDTLCSCGSGRKYRDCCGRLH